jgi:3-methyladenine DNA glycosylase/8-oxoguanine DNA glycosylase
VDKPRPKPRNRSPEADGSQLPFDPVEAVRHVSAKDARLAKLIERVGPLRLRLADLQSLFEALSESIVYQQLSGYAAAAIFARFVALFRPRKFPRPGDLLAMPDERLRAAGLSRGKIAALRDLATKTIDGTVPQMRELRKLSDDEVVERLSAVRGIGRWTAEMLLIFRLGRPDVLPATDYGVRKGFARVYRRKELPTPKELLAAGEKWRPYRTVASWYFWRALEESG